MAPESWDITGRVAPITGGARGIGLDAAGRLVDRGMRVALVDADGERAAREAEALGDERAAAERDRRCAYARCPAGVCG